MHDCNIQGKLEFHDIAEFHSGSQFSKILWSWFSLSPCYLPPCDQIFPPRIKLNYATNTTGDAWVTKQFAHYRVIADVKFRSRSWTNQKVASPDLKHHVDPLFFKHWIPWSRRYSGWPLWIFLSTLTTKKGFALSCPASEHCQAYYYTPFAVLFLFLFQVMYFKERVED